jgi:hypothetical protein
MRNRFNGGVEGAVWELPRTPKEKSVTKAAVYPGAIFRQEFYGI